MPIHRKNNISYLTFPVLDDLGVVHGFFMRHGGCSSKPWNSLNLATSVGDSREAVIENRHRITNTLNKKNDSIFDVWQVHSDTVVYSDKPRKLNTPHIKADAIITDCSEVSLMMLFADCVPILLYDPEKNISAIAHAGWKGTASKIVSRTVEKMADDHACNPGSIIACIGPSIGEYSYQVGSEVINAVNLAFQKPDDLFQMRGGHHYFNLQLANKRNLKDSGVIEIFITNIDTAENTNDWFSHRAEGGRTGRFAAVMTCN